MRNEDEVTKKNLAARPSPVKRFLLTCSGVDQALLERCPSEQQKFVGLGSAVLFSIDQFLVSTQLNPVTLSESPVGWLTRVRRMVTTLTAAGIRLVASSVVALLIAEPLLLAVFRTEIDQHLIGVRAAAETQDRIDTLTVVYDRAVGRINDREAVLTAGDPRVQALVDQRHALDDNLAAEQAKIDDLACCSGPSKKGSPSQVESR